MALLSGSLADGVEIAIRYFKPLMEKGFADRSASLAGETADRRSRCRLLARTDREPRGNERTAAPVRRSDAPARAGRRALLAQGLLQLVLVIFFVFFIFRDAHIYADALHTGSRMLAGDLGERMLALAKGRSPASWSASSAPRPRRRWWR
jgi:hypothetical protein